MKRHFHYCESALVLLFGDITFMGYLVVANSAEDSIKPVPYRYVAVDGGVLTA